MSFEVRALDESTWPAFAALVEANGGIFGGCWCVGMHPEGFDPRGAEGNKERKLAMIRADATHAALVFEGDECVGWAQFGPPAEVARIKNRPAAEKGRELPDWRIGCCYAGKGHRRQGVYSRRDRRSGRPDPGAGRRDGRGLPGGRRRRGRRLPVPRCAVDVREARLRAGGQGRQAPLGGERSGSRRPGATASRGPSRSRR